MWQSLRGEIPSNSIFFFKILDLFFNTQGQISGKTFKLLNSAVDDYLKNDDALSLILKERGLDYKNTEFH